MGVDSICRSDFVAKMEADIILFKDTFEVVRLTEEDTFDRVAFIEAEGYYVFLMQLYVYTEIYPMSLSDRFEMAVTRTLNLNGTTPKTGYYTQEESLADSYEYVMCGKLYMISEEQQENSDESEETVNLEIEISFSGLLTVLKRNPSYVSQLEHDHTLFFLIRKL